jgi:fatty acid synthase subunit alpha, fungi type
MDVTAWLSNPPFYTLSRLCADFIPAYWPHATCPQYLIVCRVLGLTPGEMRSRIAGTTGHSQDIVSSVAISASTFESFTSNPVKASKWLFLCWPQGTRSVPHYIARAQDRPRHHYR